MEFFWYFLFEIGILFYLIWDIEEDFLIVKLWDE